MVFTTFANGAKGVVDFSWNGTPASVILHWEKAAPVEADYIALAAALALEWKNEMMPLLSNDLVMGDVTVYDLSAEFAPKFVNSSQNGSPGIAVGDSVPNNTSALLSHRTTATGRSGRGRTYLPGIVESDESDGLLTTGRRTTLVSDWADFIVAVGLSGWDFVIAQRFSAGVQLTVGVLRDVVTEILKLQLATQRRRQVQSAV